MQIDMHYYGTYAMARAAGLKKDICKTIATAAQYVDDNAVNKDIKLYDGSSIHIIATAHHAADIKNISEKDQRKVWVPFHFLPGNQGTEFRDRLVCQKNSKIAELVKNYVFKQENCIYFVELAGIFAHIYADTFSHYGFSGITDDRNKVYQNETKIMNILSSIEIYLEVKKKLFIEKFLANIAESSKMGHGAVYTYPDRPYLEWSVKYEKTDKVVIHDNFVTFNEGCRALYDYFRTIGVIRPDLLNKEDIREYSEISETIEKILSLQKPKLDRIAIWQDEAKKGNLFKFSEEIPEYENWNEEIQTLQKGNSETIKNHTLYHFFQAASNYRTFLLRDLLPKHGLIVG